MLKLQGYIILLALLSLVGCVKDIPEAPSENTFKNTPYDLKIPIGFPPVIIPENNPMTEEGVNLGRHLFWEKKLSGNNTMSCGTCHFPASSFSDSSQFSIGINGDIGTRQAMTLINLAWGQFFFWDGKAMSLEEQAGIPVENPIEMADDWNNVIDELKNTTNYPILFSKAFENGEINKDNATKAIAQFMRTMISANSKFDRHITMGEQLTEKELAGFELFKAEGGQPEETTIGQGGGDCFHCHSIGGLQFTDNNFHNNGLDFSFADEGLGGITKNASDMGLFKTPTLRNVELSAPYMHDGRFKTLEEVIGHYDHERKFSATADAFIVKIDSLKLSPEEQGQIIAFLKTLTDWTFIANPYFQNPHE